jgi:predicted SnoaL-like aldol condensation-catalyzing enzyme
MTTLRVLSLSCVSLIAAQAFAQSRTNPAEANKKLVLEFYRLVWETKNADAVPQFVAEGYIEHNPRFGSGRDSLIRDHNLQSGQAAKPADTLRFPPALVIAEGDLVTLIFKRDREDPKDKSKTYESFGFDTFRIKAGKIVEHWDGATKGPADRLVGPCDICKQ